MLNVSQFLCSSQFLRMVGNTTYIQVRQLNGCQFASLFKGLRSGQKKTFLGAGATVATYRFFFPRSPRRIFSQSQHVRIHLNVSNCSAWSFQFCSKKTIFLVNCSLAVIKGGSKSDINDQNMSKDLSSHKTRVWMLLSWKED